MIACYQCKHSWTQSIWMCNVDSLRLRCSRAQFESDGVSRPKDMPCQWARGSTKCTPQPTLITRLKEIFA